MSLYVICNISGSLMATSFLACFPSNIHSSCYYLVLIQSWVVGAAMSCNGENLLHCFVPRAKSGQFLISAPSNKLPPEG